MEAKERVIRKLLMEQRCHRCGDHFAPESRIVLARRREIWMVMASCSLCEQMDTFIVQFPPPGQGQKRVTSYRLSRPPTPALPPQAGAMSPQPHQERSVTTITIDDVLDMRQFLKHFDGDFQRLFAEIE
ncbi:MAG TPA: hypothetical protein VNE38_04900 [Ktedonobacteraceae bacterium]|nr:hypothetical protein [Ktedonobacteraceae bacterium]